MKGARDLPLLCLLLWAAGQAVAQPAAPTDFERFAAEPAVEIVESNPVGTLDSTDAGLSVTVLKLKDRSSVVGQTGVMFELSNNGGSDRVYADREQLLQIRTELRRMVRGSARRAENRLSVYQVEGVESCWMPQNPVRILCPGFRSGPDWSGLQLGAYGGTVFSFPDRKPAQFLALVEQALVALDDC